MKSKSNLGRSTNKAKRKSHVVIHTNNNNHNHFGTYDLLVKSSVSWCQRLISVYTY